MLVALMPNVAAGLGASLPLVAAAITAYMVPFAALQLVSGTLAERVGSARVVRAGYVAFGAAALLCALAPGIWLFLAARAPLVWFGVGCGSAFVWAGLNTITVESFPANRAGAVSAYSAFTFAGVALVYVPLFDVDTRAPFYLAAAFSVLLAVLVTPWFPRYREATA
jgi:MFS family permease